MKTLSLYLQDELKKKETTLYDYQINAVLTTKEYFRFNGTKAQPALIVAPTGSGKSGILTMLPYVLGSAKVVILTPSLIITKQLATCFGISNDVDQRQETSDKRQESFFYKTKICTDIEQLSRMLENGKVIHSTKQIKYMNSANLVIVNAQKFCGTAKTNLEDNGEVVVENVGQTFKTFTTLIVDEAHHYPAKTWKKIVENFKNKQIVFLTATPYRKSPDPPYRDGPILENQEVTYEIKKTDVQGKTIRMCDFKELPLELAKAESLGEAQLRKIGEDIKLILSEHDALEPGVTHKAMVLVFRTDQAENGAQHIDEATYYTSAKTTIPNKIKFDDDKNCRILFVCGKLLEGYDNHNVSVVVILRNVVSRVLFTQFIGRSVRKSPKDVCMSGDDSVSGLVLSYSCYNQQQMWDQHDKIAEKHPEKEQEENDMDLT